jgi:phosphatidylglycerol:prolipoprotein diacylglycerol transferase
LYKGNWKSVFSLRSGGLAFYGGLIGSVIVAYFICKWKKVKLAPMLDMAGLGFLIGQSVGRWGNFVNIEAFGSNTTLPWGMTSSSISSYLSMSQYELGSLGVKVDPSIPVHPCFLYESLWCLAGFIVLNSLYKKRKFDGEIFLMYCAWNGFGRFFIESLRTDSLLLGNLKISQVLAVIFFVTSPILIIFIRYKIKHENDAEFMPLYVTTEESINLIAEIDEQLKNLSKTEKSIIAVPLSEDMVEGLGEEIFEEKSEGILEDAPEKVSEEVLEELPEALEESEKPEEIEEISDGKNIDAAVDAIDITDVINDEKPAENKSKGKSKNKTKNKNINSEEKEK